MQLISRRGQNEVWYREASRPYVFEPPFPDELYVCLLFIHDTTVTPEEQRALSEQIVASGCRFAVCAGYRCSTWDDSIDLAYLATDATFEPPDETFVMTTWHENDSLDDIVLYGLAFTSFDDHDFRRYLIQSIGSRSGFTQDLEAAIKAVWSDHTKV